MGKREVICDYPGWPFGGNIMIVNLGGMVFSI
jgi:hypothetical protein